MHKQVSFTIKPFSFNGFGAAPYNANSLMAVDNMYTCKSWNAMMDSGRDPREGLFLCLGLIGRWLLAVAIYKKLYSPCYTRQTSTVLDQMIYALLQC